MTTGLFLSTRKIQNRHLRYVERRPPTLAVFEPFSWRIVISQWLLEIC